MNKYTQIKNFSDFEKLINRSELILVFKHSTRCPISVTALNEFKRFLERGLDVVSAYIDVIEDRALSNQVASFTNIEHESPQILLFKSKNVLWSASHSEITEDSIIKAISLN